jgi:ParB family chromosome partitioning protein
MKLRKVDPSTIKVPEIRVTSQFDPEMLAMFQESCKNQGIIAPILCCEIDESLVLIDGLHRLSQALDNKLPKIDVVIVPGDMTDVLTKNLYLDHMRGKHPIHEMVKVIEALWKEYGLDSDKIAAKTGLSRDYIERLQKISQLTPDCRQALEDGLIGVGHANALTHLTDPIKQSTVLSQQLLYRWSVKDLEAYIADVLKLLSETLQETTPGVQRAPGKLVCAFCRGEFELGQVANPNTCQECSAIMFASMAEAKRQLAAE